jgi:hypothetical protein
MSVQHVMLGQFASLRKALILLLALPSLVAGCTTAGGPPPPGLATFDPFAANPETVAIAVKTDRHLVLRTGDLVMRVVAEAAGASLGDERFVLTVEDEAGDQEPGTAVGPGEHLVVARLAPADLDRFRSLQQRVSTARTSRQPGGKASISIRVKSGCRSGTITATPTVRSYLRSGSSGGFVPLTEDIPLEGMLGRRLLSAFPPCA